jgi:hypothetical protein
MINMTRSKLSIFSHPGKITGYWITTRSFPYRGPYCPGQYGPQLRLFSRCRKYVINSLIHGHFHIGLVIIPRPILARDGVEGQYVGLGMITRPIWKCPCINLYLLHIELMALCSAMRYSVLLYGALFCYKTLCSTIRHSVLLYGALFCRMTLCSAVWRSNLLHGH